MIATSTLNYGDGDAPDAATVIHKRGVHEELMKKNI